MHDPTTEQPGHARRPLARSLRWFLGELLVVVTGVLIAIGLNSWWEGRQHEATARNNIRKLASELRIEAAFL